MSNLPKTADAIIFVNGVERDAEIHYIYHKGFAGSQFEPPEDEYFEVLKIMCNGVDIKTLFDDKMIVKMIEESF